MKNTFNSIKYLACLLMTVTAFSCTKNFTELNQNPNQASVAAPETLLGPALYDVLNTNLVRCHRLNNDLMQVSVFMAETREFHRYVIRPTESDAMWNGWYLELTNFRDMYKSAAAINHKSYMGIALIMDAWVSSMITDMFGDVSYFQSNMGKEQVLTPAFDKQKDIYADLYKKLDSANTLLAANVALTDQQKSLDILYQGDVTKWRKLGNSLYLRLLMRMADKPEMQVGAKINDILVTSKANYPVFTSNTESAVLR
ncbi:MAG: SusD/RagB family nutrient-binding outer membrane lipoprotein, partial [Bacteroidetes bacterium]|nr:SusD/RagB family nutrient-binding outer membrane lipoprotein [Bacteroidota bacterium]